MSRPMPIMKKCAICHNESRQIILLSTNRFGAPDLDLRPPEMMRSTMCWWLQECPHCGYVCEDLEKDPCVKQTWLEHEEYATCGGIDFASSLAKRFYRAYLISCKTKACSAAFRSALRAAWACDDAGDKKNADLCRRLALEKLEQLIRKKKGTDELQIQRLNILRRIGDFESVVAACEEFSVSDQFLQKIVAFELERANAGDDRCYTVDDVQ